MTPAAGDRFRTAALAYLVYGSVYLLGGLWLLSQGVGVMGGQRPASLLFWGLAGLVPLTLIPYLLFRPRAWFERWVLCRRDFARLLALFLAFRTYKVGQVALRGESAEVAAPWGGVVTFQAGAAVFLVVTLAATALVAVAAWSPAEPRSGQP